MKSPTSRLFTHPFIQAQIKENIKAPRHWPLCGGLTGNREFPTQMVSNMENASLWCRQHDYQMYCYAFVQFPWDVCILCIRLILLTKANLQEQFSLSKWLYVVFDAVDKPLACYSFYFRKQSSHKLLLCVFLRRVTNDLLVFFVC